MGIVCYFWRISLNPPSVTSIATQLKKKYLDQGLKIPQALIFDEAKSIQKHWNTSENKILSNLRNNGAKRSVINATGILIHTNLGRSPFSEAVLNRMAGTLSNYINLEMDLGAGKRSKRTDYLDQMFKCLNSAYKPVWVGNCAAAVLLVLNTLKKRELYHSVLLSRGEMVEIGGGFRVPDIMSESGLNIIEVGTTNRTTIKDFERGLKKNQQSIVCRIHPSNFRMEGFTTSVDPRDLIQLSKKHRAPLIYDAGTLTQREITSVKSGFEAVTLSLDKTFGGPQCGLIMATPKLQLEILRNPMYRAMRLDKLSIVALESTLEIYLDKTDRQEIPLQKFFYADLEKTRMRAEKIMSMVSNSILLSFSAVPCVGQMGGGSIASDSFKSWGIEITSKKTSLQKLNHFLQTAKTPMVASVSDGKILINLAAVFDKQDQEITHLLSAMKEHFSQP